MSAYCYETNKTKCSGPDVFVLNVDFNKEKGTLDCYQIKNWSRLPTDKELVTWLQSLGKSVEVDKVTKEVTTKSNPSNEALYTSKSVECMMSDLSKSLGVSISLGKCCIVIRQSAKQSNNCQHLNSLAKSGIAEVWTSDFLEPTFSAIPSQPEQD